MMTDFFSDKPRTTPGYQKSKVFYSDDFVDALAQDYDFDCTDINLLTYLYEIPHRYNVANAIHNGDREFQPQNRKNLLKLQAKFKTFKDELYAQGGDRFNLEVSDGAGLCGELNPNLDPDDYPGKAFSKNYCYWFEFERYLKFFEEGLKQTLKNTKPRGGRPKNEGLHNAIHYIASFWEFKLLRKYTLDHHNGKGLTEAYKFTRRLLAPLDQIDEKQIITAMRAEIKERNEVYPEGYFHRKVAAKKS